MKTTLLKRVLQLWDTHDGMLVSQYVDGPAEPLMEEIRAELAKPEPLEPYSPEILAALEPPLGDCCREEPWPTTEESSEPASMKLSEPDATLAVSNGVYTLTMRGGTGILPYDLGAMSVFLNAALAQIEPVSPA